MLEIIVRPDAAALVASADGGRRSESHRDHGLEWGRILSASLCQHRYQQVCGQGRGRTADLPIFSRTLVPTELPGRAGRMSGLMLLSDPDGTRTRDLRLDRATR